MAATKKIRPPADSSPLNDPVLAECRFAFEQLATGKLEAYDGEYVAVLDETVQGHGADPEKLRAAVASHHQVHPERVFLLFVAPRTL